MLLTPEIEGAVAIQSSAQTFAKAFTKRVADGLLTGQPHPRSNYHVVEASSERLRIRAADWWTVVLFWGFVWPWLLVALHKRPLRRLLTRLIVEVDSRSASRSGSSPLAGLETGD